MQATNNTLNHTAACYLFGIFSYIANTGMRAAGYYVNSVLLLVDQRRIIHYIIIVPAVSQAMLSHRLFVFKVIHSGNLTEKHKLLIKPQRKEVRRSMRLCHDT